MVFVSAVRFTLEPQIKLGEEELLCIPVLISENRKNMELINSSNTVDPK